MKKKSFPCRLAKTYKVYEGNSAWTISVLSSTGTGSLNVGDRYVKISSIAGRLDGDTDEFSDEPSSSVATGDCLAGGFSSLVIRG